MDLILWRHAEAEEGMPDSQRRLTAKGERQAEKMAGFLSGRLPANARILVSPAMRTRQTALALTRHFDTDQNIGPGAVPQDVLNAAGWSDREEGCVLLVGHQPYLGQIAAMLMAKTEISFSIKKGAVWWLRRDRAGDHQVNLRLAISPEFL